MAITGQEIESSFLFGRLTLDKFPLDVPIVVGTFAVVALLGGALANLIDRAADLLLVHLAHGRPVRDAGVSPYRR